MTQPTSIQMGETGESFGEHFFNKIGWGPVRTGKHDVGTDLFVQMRGEDLTELGLLLGVQVKYGDSWFEPAEVDEESGWWFREGANHHGEYWRGHHVPHIVILVSEDEQTAVWAVLDGSTIQSTGVGIKVFVPASQKLEAGRKDEWIEYVVGVRRRLSHEGSRWTFSSDQVPSNQWARFAMVAPRIVSPHPNRGTDAAFSWPEAIAVCVEGEPERCE